MQCWSACCSNTSFLDIGRATLIAHKLRMPGLQDTRQHDARYIYIYIYIYMPPPPLNMCHHLPLWLSIGFQRFQSIRSGRHSKQATSFFRVALDLLGSHGDSSRNIYTCVRALAYSPCGRDATRTAAVRVPMRVPRPFEQSACNQSVLP